VRMTLVPAVLALLGSRAWWLPQWLDRLLPRADIEGGSLVQGNLSLVGAETGGTPASGSHQLTGRHFR
jgi:hypothetical protein